MTTLPADHHHAAAHDHAHHHEIGFIRKYVFSMDHKVIGIQFMFTSLIFLLVGGLLALAVRWQIAWPFDVAQPLPFFGESSRFFTPSTQVSVMPGDFYNMLFTMHATFMIFFVIIPMLVGAFGNVLIPLQIGARDMAFPLLNMLSYWVALAGGVMMVSSFYYQGAQGGWTSYPPLSLADFSNQAQSLWLISLITVGTSSLMGAVNYLTTILNLRAPGMTLFRMPLTVWSLFITSILILMSTPVLASALLMLLFDRHFGTSFFTISDQVRAGTALSTLDSGQPLLFQHLFWFYSHPAVYIMILPAMGIASDVLATFARKPIFGYKPMVFAIAGIAFLGFIVWGHHMFASGMNPILGTTFMASTIMIAVPSAIKVFNWMGTLWGGQIRFTPAMLFAIGFVSMFIIGGLSGIFMASAPVDLYIHDTYFIVGHIHYVLFGGSLLGIFAGIYYWYPKMFGRNMNQSLGVLHFWMTLISFNVTFFLMHVVGVGGHPRRYATILEYPTLEFLQPLNIVMTIGALMLGMSQIPFVVNVFCSLGRFGNRLVIYPLIIAALQYLPLSPWQPISSIMGLEGVSLFARIGLVLSLFVIMGLADYALMTSMGRINGHDGGRDHVGGRWIAVATFLIAFPAFFMPVFVKGDFWELIGVNSVTYAMSRDSYLSAPMQPYPTAVDASAMSPSEHVMTIDAEGAMTPAETPAVTAVLVDYTRLAAAAESAGIDLTASPLAPIVEETRDRYNLVSFETAMIAGLAPELKTLVEGSRVMVSGWIAEVQKQNLIPNRKVSRTWNSKIDGNFRIVAFTNVRMGWIITGLTAVFGLLLLMRRNTQVFFGYPVGSNPWRANSLEWYASSPPWFENFPETPQVYRGPYEFSSPVAKDDYLPQWHPPIPGEEKLAH